MRRVIVALIAAAPLVSAQPAFAQERPGPGRIEIGAFPVGAVFFTGSSSRTEPDFGNFALGATLTVNLSPWLGIEGEVGNAVGLDQEMRFRNATLAEQHSPCMYAYSGNIVVNPLGRRVPVLPYLTAGVGGITMLGEDDVAALGVTENTTFLTGNVGGGTKWYLNRRWGLRADYRLLIVDDKPDAPEFFGRDSVRYGHRVYAGLLFSY